MSQETLDFAANTISAALSKHDVEALIVVIPGDGRLYGSAMILSDLDDGIAALGLVDGVHIRTPHKPLGLVTFDYMPEGHNQQC